MNVLLFSMPDSFEHTPSFAMRFPNGALASLAGNVDAHHDVAIADLVLVQHAVPQTVRELVTTRAPDIVGLSVMTFQRKTAYKVIAFVRALRPEAWIVVGGYDPSLAPETYEDPALGVDFIVRGEGDITFCKLLRTIEHGGDFGGVAGLYWRRGDRFVRNPRRPESHLAGEVLPPKRARIASTGSIYGGNAETDLLTSVVGQFVDGDCAAT